MNTFTEEQQRSFLANTAKLYKEAVNRKQQISKLNAEYAAKKIASENLANEANQIAVTYNELQKKANLKDNYLINEMYRFVNKMFPDWLNKKPVKHPDNPKKKIDQFSLKTLRVKINPETCPDDVLYSKWIGEDVILSIKELPLMDKKKLEDGKEEYYICFEAMYDQVSLTDCSINPIHLCKVDVTHIIPVYNEEVKEETPEKVLKKDKSKPKSKKSGLTVVRK